MWHTILRAHTHVCIHVRWYIKVYICNMAMGVLFIHLFVYICWSSEVAALMFCYHSTIPSTCKGDISASYLSSLQVYFSCLIYR